MSRVFGALAIAALVCSMRTAGQSPQTVTAQDKAEIQALVTAYARTLGSCAASEYADLFAADRGYFASGFRGHVVGRERLIAMVQSERFCFAARFAASRAVRRMPKTSGRPARTA